MSSAVCAGLIPLPEAAHRCGLCYGRQVVRGQPGARAARPARVNEAAQSYPPSPPLPLHFPFGSPQGMVQGCSSGRRLSRTRGRGTCFRRFASPPAGVVGWAQPLEVAGTFTTASSLRCRRAAAVRHGRAVSLQGRGAPCGRHNDNRVEPGSLLGGRRPPRAGGLAAGPGRVARPAGESERQPGAAAAPLARCGRAPGGMQSLPAGWCAQHERCLGGERPLRRLIAPTVSQRQGRRREAESEGSRRQTCDRRDTNPIGGHTSRASWPPTAKPDAIKGGCGRWGRGAGKGNALTWGDLSPGRGSR